VSILIKKIVGEEESDIARPHYRLPWNKLPKLTDMSKKDTKGEI